MAVTIADVATTLLRPTPEAGSVDALAWAMWIEDARRKIKNRLGNLELLDQDDLDYVVREAVAAKAENPTGKTNERLDDYSYGLAGAVSREVNITDEWWKILTPANSGGAFSIRPYYVPDDPASMLAWREAQE